MVNMENYEEYMMMYADGELNEAAQKALMAFVDAHPALRNELEAYKAVKLIPDTALVYTNKEGLLKTPPAGGRSIGMRTWWMYATAAAVLLFTITIVKQNGNTTDSPVVANNTQTEQPASAQLTQTPVINYITQKDSNTEELHSTPASSVAHENVIAKAKSKKQKVKSPIIEKRIEEPKIVKEESTVQPPVYKIANEPVQEVIAQQTAQPNSIEETTSAPVEIINNEPKQKKRLLDILPINKNKKEGMNIIANALTKRIENVTENLKDTDVKLKIGNKEIFIVKL